MFIFTFVKLNNIPKDMVVMQKHASENVHREIGCNGVVGGEIGC